MKSLAGEIVRKTESSVGDLFWEQIRELFDGTVVDSLGIELGNHMSGQLYSEFRNPILSQLEEDFIFEKR